MKIFRNIVPVVLMLMIAFETNAQGSFDLYSISQTDLRGTARFMSMAGAFGALGGDLSSLNQNPGGIGVYRSSEIGVTMGVTKASAKTDYLTKDQTQFQFNNIGYVGTFHTNSDVTPTFSWGFSYNKVVDFRRHYAGFQNSLSNSATNYIANQSQGWSYDDLGAVEGGYDPYLQSNAPWMSILAYNSYLINPVNGSTSEYQGLYQSGTTGFSELEVEETGRVNEYSVSFGGNVSNKFMWGATLGVVDMTFSQYSYYGESLTNAQVPYVSDNNVYIGNGTADWGLQNYLDIDGTGVNFKLGAIFKPVNEFRLGLAFHTPTFYTLKSKYYANTSFSYEDNSSYNTSSISGSAETNEGYYGETEFEARTPWHVIISAAGVIGGRGIISLDYERVQYNGMKSLFDGRIDKDVETNVKDYFKAANIVRIGGEFKVTPKFSVRAGYSYQSSPIKSTVANDEIDVITSGTTLNYTVDKNIQYITAGLGYRHKSFYIDMAYVHKQRNSDYHSFSSEEGVALPGIVKIKDSNNELDFSIGFKF